MKRFSYLQRLQMNIADQIFKMRTKEGWSKGELSRRLNTSIAQVSRLEDPERCKTNLETLVKLAKLFKRDLQIKFVKRR